MSDVETRFHETWLGMVQPTDGLVVSLPVLVAAQCFQRQPPRVQEKLHELCPPAPAATADEPARRIADLQTFLAELLDLTPDLFDTGPAIPDSLSLYVAEGKQTLRPTLALRSQDGSGHAMLVWELPDDLALDKPETQTGAWEYPPAAKFDRLLRHTRVPIGLLTNRRELRLVYAPHGESTGSITFRLDDMATVGGRPILDAFIMLLSATRFFAVAKEQQLPALLEQSRKHQGEVTTELAEQVFQALQLLLSGFDAAAERDGRDLLRESLEYGDEHFYGGLLTVLLRLVFVLYAEDRGLLPVDHPLYAEHYSLQDLFARLQADQAAHPDSMSLRFGAWNRLIALFRAVFLGVAHGELEQAERAASRRLAEAGARIHSERDPLRMPSRRGELFDPNVYPFLEGWGPGGSAPITMPENRAEVRVPTVDDETVYQVLERLVFLGGQRLSYRALDVEQIGSVYEALMGYHVVRVSSAAVCLRTSRVWVSADEVLSIPASRREAWLKDESGADKSAAKKVAPALSAAKDEAEVLEALEPLRAKGVPVAGAGRLVLQPGAERRRTSSHYTPRSLTEPIVEHTLAPLIAAMGESPKAERLLELVICDPAMGSGAFLVAACRYLADQVVAAWTRDGQLEAVAAAHEDVVNHARRLVAERCLYGVDKNRFAVNLAKLSLWLVTLAKDAPFTFVDHALRHGDSLVGVSAEQLRSFHWQPGRQLELCRAELEAALAEAIEARKEIRTLSEDPSPYATREKERLLFDAEDALSRVRLVADVLVGAFFAAEKDKAREDERKRRLAKVLEWLEGSEEAKAELLEWQAEVRERLTPFHWELELPEVFDVARADPLEADRVNEEAYVDAFVGNPPFLGGKRISTEHGDAYAAWLEVIHQSSKNADLAAHFFRRADSLIGAHGTIGLIATNTIGQGDTRTAGLQHLVGHGYEIYRATRSMVWPGEAAVAVSVVHLAKGTPRHGALDRRLDEAPALAINSRLRSKPERPDPSVLAANAGLSFQGSILVGMGFTLTPEERETLVKRTPRNAERIFPYLGGEEVNSSPTQSHHRYAISFGDMSLEQAREWPDLLEIVREKVKPERDRVKRDAHRKYWWHYGDKRPALYAAIEGLPRCLVTARVTKHLMFSFQPTDRILNEKLYVFPFSGFTQLAVLQSRVHEVWTRLLSSTMKNDLNYSASDCFETFPFPDPNPRAVLPALEAIGQRLYDARAAYLLETDQGLTETYNLLKDPRCTDAPIEHLRALHLDLDRAVLAAYGWSDLEPPAFTTPATAEEEAALVAFSDEVIDRLFVLNAERAHAERLAGPATPAGRGKGGAQAGAAKKPRAPKGKAPARKKKGAGQGEMF